MSVVHIRKFAKILDETSFFATMVKLQKFNGFQRPNYAVFTIATACVCRRPGQSRKGTIDVENLKGKNILITSGPTRGYIDAVRYISNKSTGKLGALIATEALRRNACVTLVYGAGSIVPDMGALDKESARRLTMVEIETTDDLLRTIQGGLKDTSFDAIIHAMAVLDYSPEKCREGKIASIEDTLTITLQKTPKVIRQIRTQWPHAFLVGFKLEIGLSKDKLVEKAYTSMTESGANLVVANNQNEIAGDKHRAYLINSRREIVSVCETKQDISEKLMEIIAKQLNPVNV